MIVINPHSLFALLLLLTFVMAHNDAAGLSGGLGASPPEAWQGKHQWSSNIINLGNNRCNNDTQNKPCSFEVWCWVTGWKTGMTEQSAALCGWRLTQCMLVALLSGRMWKNNVNCGLVQSPRPDSFVFFNYQKNMHKELTLDPSELWDEPPQPTFGVTYNAALPSSFYCYWASYSSCWKQRWNTGCSSDASFWFTAHR